MLKTQRVIVKLNPKTIKRYWQLGYNGKPNDSISIKIEDLISTSHYKIECICQNCNTTKKVPYKSYIKYIEKRNVYYCHGCCQIKKKQTCLEKFGVEYSLQAKKIRNKIKKTCQIKYGAASYLVSKEYLSNEEIKTRIRNKNLLSGRFIPDEELAPFKAYKRKCRVLTDKVRQQLFNSWNGYDFYDKTYIKNNTRLHHLDGLFPTVDHKISIIYGFKNQIPVEKIASIENLCITKRSINVSKRGRCDYKVKLLD